MEKRSFSSSPTKVNSGKRLKVTVSPLKENNDKSVSPATSDLDKLNFEDDDDFFFDVSLYYLR